MSKELQLHYPSGANLYALLINATGSVYNGSTFETFADANIGDYDIALTEQGTASGFYAGNMPAVAAGLYQVAVREQVGGIPAISDPTVGMGEIVWDGSTVVVPASAATLDALADSLASYSASLATQINDLIFSSVILETTVSSASSNTVFELTDGSAVDDVYKDHFVVLVQVGTPANRQVGRITAYSGAIREVALFEDPGLYTVSPGDTVYVLSLKVDAFADAVWDEERAGHTTSGTFGEGVKAESLNGQAQADVEAIVDGIVQDYRLHELLDSSLSGAPVAGSLFGDLTEDDGGTQRFTTNALENAPSGGGGGGATAADIWAYATRTLTQGAASVIAAVTGSSITVYRGTTWSISLTGLGNISTYDIIYLSVKVSEDDSDNNAILRVKNDVNGLLRLNKAAPTSASNGTITVDNATSGNITITVNEAETQNEPLGQYVYDVKGVDSDGSVVMLSAGGQFNIRGDITRTIS